MQKTQRLTQLGRNPNSQKKDFFLYQGKDILQG